jgi:hypothetical protein
MKISNRRIALLAFFALGGVALAMTVSPSIANAAPIEEYKTSQVSLETKQELADKGIFNFVQGAATCNDDDIVSISGFYAGADRLTIKLNSKIGDSKWTLASDQLSVSTRSADWSEPKSGEDSSIIMERAASRPTANQQFEFTLQVDPKLPLELQVDFASSEQPEGSWAINVAPFTATKECFAHNDVTYYENYTQ